MITADPMKNIISAFLFITLAGNCMAQDTNGWEFLSWNMSKDSVQILLDANKSKLGAPNALDADFKYQEMNTWLIYDPQNRLIKVHQRNTFSVIQAEEAEVFYNEFKTVLTKKYGKPDHYNNDKKDCVITMSWALHHTKITFEYDYKYKVIDEFGAGSYWIDVVFESTKTD